ncbi:MAG: transcription/translation regulatory transformer protein RfaH [Xanthomonadales bacterium]|nr:transcription/translation regulatory transformer protein RfaH [Xanthomonadales bacterium]NNL94535.1 transcription/translation regulatory transformer protein RfaH [Xanthomonadales bacterium]
MQNNHPQWFAVYARPRQERIARDHLERQGFKCFLPEALNPYQRRSRANKPLVQPLFPRYLFLKAVPETQNLATVRSTRGVVGLVRSGFELVRVPEAVINMIRARLDESGLVRLDPAPVEEGDRVRVFDGPFCGAEGILEAKTGEQRAMLLMDLLGRQTRVEVDAMLLQRVG